ncbi:REP-associated tyrosine transposase [Marinomonas shanghaiensis]|jgi:putative transposase|uniref:REP-associated tyrosine transposase n=1 Tax=Marinomonas shanghaiensis TaxID=2202418 RepID=UPI000DBA0FB1|nr:transposase [Marinomonas shanghaiensis]
MSWSDLRKGRLSEPNREYFITFNTLDKIPYFNDFSLAHLFCKQIEANQRHHKCTWLTWVLMPDHFHGLVKLEKHSSTLPTIIGNLKGASAFNVNKHLKRSGKLWQPSFYDRALRAEEDRLHIARYIVANPLRKGLVKSVKDYPFWNSLYL